MERWKEREWRMQKVSLADGGSEDWRSEKKEEVNI